MLDSIDEKFARVREQEAEWLRAAGWVDVEGSQFVRAPDGTLVAYGMAMRVQSERDYERLRPGQVSDRERWQCLYEILLPRYLPGVAARLADEALAEEKSRRWP